MRIRQRRPFFEPLSERQFEFVFETLEERCMLTGIGFDVGSGIVTITGSALGDTGLVSMLDANTVEVELTGVDTQQFALSAVNKVIFNGLDGADMFQNSTAIDSEAIGGDGNDQFAGGSGADRFVGGVGNDILLGNGGNDALFGSEGNDEIRGGAGDDFLSGQFGSNLIYGEGGADRIFAGIGDDTVYGGTEDDKLWGLDGVDRLFGEEGADLVRGFAGNDELHGGSGEDVMLGDAGDDEIYGDADFDIILGGSGNDTIQGGGSRDHIYGQGDNDILYGDDGNDAIFGGDGDDQAYGGAGPDLIRGDAGNDVLFGGDASDRLHGGTGNDELNGEDGQDFLYGDNDNDRLFGGSHRDELFGGNGNDGLFGGDANFDDELSGQGDADRFLIQGNDTILDSTAIDATLVFVNRTSNWTDLEIRGIDNGLDRLHSITNNTILLKDPYPSGDLTFYKYTTTPSGAPASNYFAWRSQTNCGPGGCNTTYTYTRELRFADWDETNAFYQNAAADLAVHEIAHNFDSSEELLRVSPNLEYLWSTFEGVSGWTDTNPNDPTNYSLSNDGQWWYLSNSSFVWNYGRTNPKEDFATLWEYYFDDYQNDHDRPDLQSKLDVLDTLFGDMTTP